MIITPELQHAERALLGGRFPCPRCLAVLRPHGTTRRRTIQGPGQQRLTATPSGPAAPTARPPRCWLPAELVTRPADSAQAIGQALADKAQGHGWRTIAARSGRPASTVRRRLRAAPTGPAWWLQQQAEQVALRLVPDLIYPW